MEKQFWKLLLDVAIIIAWIFGSGMLFEYLINRESDTGLFIVAIIAEILLTYTLYKLFKPFKIY